MAYEKSGHAVENQNNQVYSLVDGRISCWHSVDIFAV